MNTCYLGMRGTISVRAGFCISKFPLNFTFLRCLSFFFYQILNPNLAFSLAEPCFSLIFFPWFWKILILHTVSYLSLNLASLMLVFFFVRYLSVILSFTLGRNKKVEQYIRKKTHKPNVLRFWVEGGVIPLCGLALFSFLFEISPNVFPSDSPNNWY